jgi:hypothetical protein
VWAISITQHQIWSHIAHVSLLARGLGPYVYPWSCWDMADGIDSYRPRAGEIRSSIRASSWLRFLVDPMDSDVKQFTVCSYWSWNVADRVPVSGKPQDTLCERNVLNVILGRACARVCSCTGRVDSIDVDNRRLWIDGLIGPAAIRRLNGQFVLVYAPPFVGRLGPTTNDERPQSAAVIN